MFSKTLPTEPLFTWSNFSSMGRTSNTFLSVFPHHTHKAITPSSQPSLMFSLLLLCLLCICFESYPLYFLSELLSSVTCPGCLQCRLLYIDLHIEWLQMGKKATMHALKYGSLVDQGNVLISKCSLKAFPDWACTESPYFLIDVELESYWVPFSF